MDTKILLAALVGFILGALLVSTAATTFEKERLENSSSYNPSYTLQVKLS